MDHEHLHDLEPPETDRLQKPDLRRLLDGEDEERVHHAEDRDKRDEGQEKRRHVLLDGKRAEDLAIGLTPGHGPQSGL